MFHHTFSKFSGLRFPKLVIALIVVFCFGAMNSIFAQDTQVEPDAGSWQTWVIESSDQFRPAAPPDDAATAEEIAQLQELAGQRDDAALQQIAYWNAGPPAYRWNQIAINHILSLPGPGPAYRNLALLHAAIYDATIAAWDSKYTYNRPRPSDVNPALTTVIPNPDSPAYASEYAATASAASAVLGWLYPDQAEHFETLAREAANSRLLAGVDFPSDVEAGWEIGQQVAELVIARGMADNSGAAFDPATIPTGDCYWTGENPVTPMAGTWATWVMTSGDQFRPPAPPDCNSDEVAAQMQELRDFERTPASNALAAFWEYAAGGRRAFWFWNSLLDRMVLEAGWSNNAPQAARAYALMNMAGNDATVACWDAKSAYWYIRPFQLDPEFTTLFTTPNHPSYPSAHSCLSNATGGTLAYLFPTNAQEVLDLAHQASESRIWAGIHYRMDVDEGIAIGEAVADAIIEHAENDGSQ